MSTPTYKSIGAGGDVTLSSVPINVTVSLPELQNLTIPPAKVDVHIAAQEASPAPIVHVNVPEPIVNISSPVTVESPENHVHVPPQIPPEVHISPQSINITMPGIKVHYEHTVNERILIYIAVALYGILALGLSIFLKNILL